MGRRRLLEVGVDAALVLVASATGVLLELADSDPAGNTFGAPMAVRIAVQVLAATALFARRRWPVAVAAGVGVANLVVPVWATFLVPYTVLASGTRRGWLVVGALTATFLVGMRAWEVTDPFTAPVAIGVSSLLGLYARTRRSLLDELTDRAERAERERQLLADQARADERIRLASEMHDVVTHRINLLVLQAGALRTRATDDRTRGAAEELRVTGCEALAELRELVGVLREGAGHSPRPGRPETSEDLPALLDESRAAGLTVRWDGESGESSPGVRRALYRVVQEALTNVRKHAPGADVRVAVRYGPDDVRVSVVNAPSPRPPDADLVSLGAGSGLIGLRHRVDVLGGDFDSGPEPGGGFAVRARFPR
ncbi:sensor histidine kinase [Cryptosporangium arvum]|uniref:sensor histidine kinase n=1 Tax=Cryptosporangium arvum TaxID=80871 RepID=UPI0004BC0170|nr:histidine kinase [Cryptosporangium arvum]